MQRLHADDLSGYLLARGGWEHLALPMVATQNSVHDFGNVYKERVIGELLHPQRDTAPIALRTKNELGSMAFAAQYQQCPLPDDGGMVRPWWFGRYKNAPLEYINRVQSWDTAIKAGKQHDASVCLTFAEHEGKSYLLDAAVMRCEYPDLKRALYNLSERWSPQAILIEDKASGQQLLQDIRRESHLPVLPIQPKGDKITRFAAVSAMIEAGRVVLPERTPWLADFEEELWMFPHGAHDDQVDALSQYLDWLRTRISWKPSVRQL